MPNEKFYIPIRSIINLKTGKAETEMMEVSEEQYIEFLKPIGEILAEDFFKKLVEQSA